ncbi:MAG TPA: Xaa-Pro peptidase family protein [Vicinamibacterales bacterium]|jgi:Xaa-Pro aminopeptidase|nr:Xaa-Pro peptidase family protein [Vicinamibacterales bacterium]
MSLPESATLERRLARIREPLDTLSLDALIVVDAANIRYLTNHVGSAGILVLTREGVNLLVDFRYEEAVRALQMSDAACPGLRMWPVPASYDEALVSCLVELGVSSVGFEAAHVTVARHEFLTRTLAARQADVTLRPTERVVERARMVKDAAEIATLRESAARLAPVLDAAFAAVRAGVTERIVAAAIESAMRETGFERIAFDTIVASGPHSALPHYRAGDRILAGGDLVVLDFGGVYDGYCCDLTRTVVVGLPTAEQHRVHGAVLEAQQAAIAAVMPGIDASAVDSAARAVLERWGLGAAFGHGTGHGLGLDVHEEPRVTRPRPDVPAVALEPGMVFTVEPGAYLAGWGGVRIEDDVLVTATGCEVLTPARRDLLAC